MLALLSMTTAMPKILFGFGIFSFSAIIYWQFKKVSETKNTAGFSKIFLLGQSCVCLFLMLGSIFRWWNNNAWDATSTNAPLILIGFFLLGVNLYTLKVKLDNVNAAKRAGLSEAQYYRRIIAPSLQLNKASEITL